MYQIYLNEWLEKDVDAICDELSITPADLVAAFEDRIEEKWQEISEENL